MTFEPRRLVPLAYVADVTGSIEFYERLGFEVSNLFTSEEDPGPLWATLRCDAIALIFERADAPVQPQVRTVLFFACISTTSSQRVKRCASRGSILAPCAAASTALRVNAAWKIPTATYSCSRTPDELGLAQIHAEAIPTLSAPGDRHAGVHH